MSGRKNLSGSLAICSQSGFRLTQELYQRLQQARVKVVLWFLDAGDRCAKFWWRQNKRHKRDKGKLSLRHVPNINRSFQKLLFRRKENLADLIGFWNQLFKIG